MSPWARAALTLTKPGLIAVMVASASVPQQVSVVAGTAATPAPQAITLVSGDGTIGTQDPNNIFSIAGSPFAPAWIVPRHPAYSLIAGTSYISSSPNSLGPQFATTTYRTTFALPPRFSGASLSVQVHADNVATVLLNGTIIGQQPFAEIAENFQDPPSVFTTADASLFRAGANTLQFDIYNFSNPTAFDYKAVVTFTAEVHRFGVVFVHGIAGDSRTPGFESLLTPLDARYGGRIFAFTYVQDRALADASGCHPAIDVPTVQNVGLPVRVPPAGERICDSNDDVGANAVRLRQDLLDFRDQQHVDRIFLVANSMGGAIVRAYLAYATEVEKQPGFPESDRTLPLLAGVVFLQGAQQGSYLGKVAGYVDENPVIAPLGQAIENTVKEQVGIDAARPAFADLTPGSATYQFVNRAQHLPAALDYANVASDIRVQPVVVLPGGVRFPVPVAIGDYVLLLGDPDPTAAPALGGARFLPTLIGRGGAETKEWLLGATVTVVFVPPLAIPIGDVLHIPQSHLSLGSRMREITVAGPAGAISLDRAILDWIALVEQVVP